MTGPFNFPRVALIGLFTVGTIWCTLLTGCGGHSESTQPAPVHAMNGNFSILITSAGTMAVNTFGGAIQTDSGGHVTGIVHAQGELLFCFGIQLDLPFSGTIDSTGQLNATITSANNQTITLNAAVSLDGTLLSNGSYTGSGTACIAGDHGAVRGFQVQSFTGTYTSSFGPSPATSIGLTVSLLQSTTADSHGSFPVTASALTVTGGASCGFSSATLVPAGSAVRGDDLGILLLGSDNLSSMIVSGTAPNGNTSVLQGAAFILDGPCAGQIGLIILSRS